MTAKRTTRRVEGPLASHKMAEAITAAGVLSYYQRDVSRILDGIASRSLDKPVLFLLAEIPQGWPVRGNLFVTSDDGRRFRIRKNDASGAPLKHQEVPLSRARRAS